MGPRCCWWAEGDGVNPASRTAEVSEAGSWEGAGGRFKVMPAGRDKEVLGIWWGDVKRGGRSGRNRL